MRHLDTTEYISKGGVVYQVAEITSDNMYTVANWCGGLVKPDPNGLLRVHIPGSTQTSLGRVGHYAVRRRTANRGKIYRPEEFYNRFDVVLTR